MEITRKVYTSVLLILLFSVSLLTINSIHAKYSTYEKNKNEEIAFVKKFYKVVSQRQKASLNSNTSRITSDRKVISALEQHNYENLRELLLPHYVNFRTEYNDTNATLRFIRPDGIIAFDSSDKIFEGKHFSQVHNKLVSGITTQYQYGYDLCQSYFVQTAITPVTKGGSFLGIIEYSIGIDFFAERLKELTGFNIGILIDSIGNKINENHYPIYGTKVEIFNNSPEIFENFFTQLQEESFISETIEIDEKKYMISEPLNITGIHGKMSGYVYFAKDITENIRIMKIGIYKTLSMAAATLIVSLLILYTRIEKLVGVLEKRYRKKSNLLKEIHLKHKSYIQNAPSGIITFNKRLEITDCNNKICRMTDYNSDELLDMTVEKLYNDPDESKRKMFLNKLYVKGNSKDVLQIKTKNGRNIHILLSACKISDELFLCNALDVTKQVNMDRSLKVLNSQLEKMNKELEEKIEEETLKNKTQQAKIAEQRQFIDMVQMMSAVAHQWRQPLNALGLHIQDLYDSITLSENDLVFVKKFEKTSMELINQMSSTIDDFTEIAKKNKNKTEFSVIDEVVDSLNLINIQLSSSGVTFEPSCRSDCEDCPQNVLYDLEECRRKDTTLFGIPSELKQIIQHIVINSIESIEERAEKESGFEGIVKAVIECKKGRFIITIEDNGYGVSEERLYKIFNPYYTTKDITQKQGMGLYIVKSVVENSFHGEVEAFNNINGGLSVRMSIPMRNNN